MQVITAPEPLPALRINGVVPRSVFLAGSIEMNNCVDWQAQFCDRMQEFNGFIFNPRRLAWDNSWKQELTNPLFHEQVSWELTAQDNAQYIYMYFDPATKSPISLLELGLYATSKKLIVGCPDGFWRKGNVDVVCQRYGIEKYTGTSEYVQSAMTIHIRELLRGK
jgi:hypothetical protein